MKAQVQAQQNKYEFIGKIIAYTNLGYNVSLFLYAITVLTVSLVIGKNIQFLLNTIQEFNREAFLRYSAVSLSALFAAMLLRRYTFFSLLRRSELLGQRLFSDLFNHITELSLKILDAQKPGDLQSRMTGDVRNAVRIYRLDLSYICGLVFNGIGSLCLIFFINWKIGVLALLCGAAGYVVNITFLIPIQKKSRELSEGAGKMTDVFSQLIKGASIIRIFGLKRWAEERFKPHNNAMRDTGLALNRIGLVQGIAQTALAQVNTFLFLIITVFFLSRDGFRFGDALAAFYYSMAAVSFFTDMSSAFSNLQHSYASIMRFNEIMELPVEEKRGRFVRDDNGAEVINFENVTFSYNEKENMLEHFSFTVMKNDIVCLRGPSGKGKSTILKLILGLYAPSRGRITVYGQDIFSVEAGALRNAFSPVFQNPSLFAGTVFENIAAAKEGVSREDVIEAAKRANIDNFISGLPEQYDTDVGEGGKLLSGGQRQMIAIARAFLRDAPVLLLDEPLSAADGLNAAAFYAALDTLMREKTIILVSHRSEDQFLLDRFGDRIKVVEL